MTLVKITFEGNPFEGMTEEEKKIVNLALGLTAMPPDHPGYKKDSEKLDKLLKERDAQKQVPSSEDGQG